MVERLAMVEVGMFMGRGRSKNRAESDWASMDFPEPLTPQGFSRGNMRMAARMWSRKRVASR